MSDGMTPAQRNFVACVEKALTMMPEEVAKEYQTRVVDDGVGPATHWLIAVGKSLIAQAQAQVEEVT